MAEVTLHVVNWHTRITLTCTLDHFNLDRGQDQNHLAIYTVCKSTNWLVSGR